MAKQGIAMCIGLNAVDPKHYGGWDGKLQACEFDAEDMAAIAKKQRFKTNMLLTSAATRSAVKKAVSDAATKLKSGDIFMLTYSGHGGQLPDRNGDEIDLQDETWCLYDGQLVDDELDAIWAKFAAGVRILVLSDSCHSGTVTRDFYMALSQGGRRSAGGNLDGEKAELRIMPPDVAVLTYRKNRDLYDGIMKGFKPAPELPKKKDPVKATVRLISGCQDNQTSSDGTFNGLFTGMLLRVWNDGKFKGNYREFHKAIVKKMPPTQTPNHFVIGSHSPGYDADKPFTI